MSQDKKPAEQGEIVNTLTLPLQANDAIVNALKAHIELKERLTKETHESHDKLWALVHSEYPDLNVDGNFSLESDHIELGIVILKESEKCNHGDLPAGLKRLLASIAN